MEYLIKCTEIYSDVYRVEAPSLDEAVEKLDDDIRTGAVAGPELCSDSFFEEVSHE